MSKKQLIDEHPSPPPINYKQLAQGLEEIYAHPEEPLAVDTETTGLNVHDGRDHVIGISYALEIDGTGYAGYVATAHAVGENAPRYIQEMLVAVLTQPGRTLIYQGVQFDVLSLLSGEIDVREQAFYDLPTMANLIDENMPNKSMDAIAKKFAPHVKKLTEDEWLNHQKKTGWPDTTPERMWDYAVNDAVVSYITWKALIEHPEWLALAPDIWPMKQREIRCLIEMRRRGARLNHELAIYMKARGEVIMQSILDELGYEKLGPKALTELLLDKLGLPVLKKSEKTGNPSFDKEVMEQYDDLLEKMDSDIGKRIFTYRGWQKAVSAGYAAYLEAVSPDGRVRTEYTTHVTRTGRLSSKSPNLQQIPRESDKEWNGQMKACFIPSEGYTMWGIDYSQLELRLMASFAGIQSLKQVFIEGRDIFTEIAETIGQTRSATKTMVYANSYGAGPAKIATQLGISVSEAKAMINDFYGSYPELRLFSRKVETYAKRHKKIPLWSGRFRHMPYAGDSYKAMNSFIQGGGADVVGRAMVRIFDEVDNEDCRMLLQIHDAFVFEIREGLEDDYLPRIIDIMTDVDTLVAGRIPEGTGTSFAVEAEPWPTYEGELIAR